MDITTAPLTNAAGIMASLNALACSTDMAEEDYTDLHEAFKLVARHATTVLSYRPEEIPAFGWTKDW